MEPNYQYDLVHLKILEEYGVLHSNLRVFLLTLLYILFADMFFYNPCIIYTFHIANSQSSRYKGDALPIELFRNVVEEGGFGPPKPKARVLQTREDLQLFSTSIGTEQRFPAAWTDCLCLCSPLSPSQPSSVSSC